MSMMAKNITTTLLIIVISMISLNAQHQYTTSADSDPEATALLELMDSHLKDMPRIHATFEMELTFPGDEEVTYVGSFDQEGDQYFIEFGSFEIICNGVVRWVFLTDDNEVNIYNASAEDSPSTPIDFLQLYRSEDFVYRVTEEPVGHDEKSIEFKPLDKYSDFVKVRLTLKEKDGNPIRVELFEKGGSRTDLRITKLSAAENFPQGHFVFNPAEHPDIHIEDLRID